MRGPFKNFVKLIRSRAPDGVSGIEDLTSMLQTCAQSRAVALRYSEPSAPKKKTALLWLDRKISDPSLSSSSSIAETAMIATKKGGEGNASHTLPLPPRPELIINAETDLVILNKGWEAQVKGLCSPIHLQQIEIPEQVRYMGVSWESEITHNNGAEPSLAPVESRRPRGLVQRIGDLLVPYGRLAVLYLLVDPDVLSAANEQSWTATEDWSFGGNDEASLATYLAAYEEGQIHPPSFWCGWREFYEVPAEQVARLGGLEDIIRLLEIVRVRRAERQDWARSCAAAGREPVRFRLMTWRDL